MTLSCSQCGSPYLPKPQTIPATSETLERCQRLVKLNEAPGSAELAFIRALVSDTGTRLEYLDNEISRLRDRLDQLQGQRMQLWEYHSPYVPILSPLRRMPPEILVQIFLWTLPSFHERSGGVSDTQKSPWTPSRVSSRWREISLSTPSLWTTVHIDFVHEEDPLHSDILQTELQRSATLNLKAHFYGEEEADSADQLKLFDLLSKHSARWEALTIQLSSALVPRLAQLRGRLPSLRWLWLQWDSEQSQVGVDSITCFKSAPSLVDASVITKSRFIPIYVPAHQLTSYHLHGPLKMHLHVLKLAPNIVDARVVIPDLDDEEPWPEPSDQAIDLLHLRRLYVSDEQILGHLRAPRLAQLGIWVSEEETLVQELDAFFIRSACAPPELYLKGIGSVNITLDVLKKHPFIAALALVFFHGGVDVMEAHLTVLAHAPESEHLREICFGAVSTAADPMPIDYPLFLRMLKSRRRSSRCSLRAASFFAMKGPDPDPVTLAGLEELRDGGLDLRVESGLGAQLRINEWENVSQWNMQ
ncbi:hypothetical protein FB45DRAFT_373478 [Roridomyces roridus]|uniref:F-box domain-containing protein n=1 Tax=Roridomyces roridus TaxID=1738132 RepID=A0AAD7FAJ2_9AGAR|nr:hypothetical protein FB45DRAFT_373478 [Roridomyces roridus]